MRLALENAVHNACNYAKTKVEISAQMACNQLMFIVADDGEGFPQEVLEHLAKQQYTEASCRGTGLGMLLSSKIAELHQNKGQHGFVQLYNEHGAVFEMSLP